MKWSKRIFISLVLLAVFGTAAQISPSIASTKPDKPILVSITSGKARTMGGIRVVDLTVKVANAAKGANATSKVVFSSNIYCVVTLASGSCVLRGLPVAAVVSIAVKGKNQFGFGPSSTPVKYIAGSISWPGIPVSPKITRVSALNTDFTLNFTPPVNNGGKTITNYSYSTDGGATWKLRSPASAISPLRLANVSAANHSFAVRAINGYGKGLVSASFSYKSKSKKYIKLAIKFKSLTNSRGLIVKTGKGGIGRASLSDEESVDVVSITETGEMVSAISSNLGDIQIDRIFIGPLGRTIAVLQPTSNRCGIAEISPVSGNTVCLATYEQASLGNVAVEDLQLGGYEPISFDSQDNAYATSFGDLIKISVDGTITQLTGQPEVICSERSKSPRPGLMVAWIHPCGTAAGSEIVVYDTTGPVLKTTTVCTDCDIMAIAITPDGNAIISSGQLQLLSMDDFSLTPITFDNSAGLPDQYVFSSAKLLPDNRLVAIPQAYAGSISQTWKKPNPLMQYFPQRTGESNTFLLENVPVPLIMSSLGRSSVVAGGVADPETCWCFLNSLPLLPTSSCPGTIRLSIFNFDTKVETPIDLVGPLTGNQERLALVMLSGSPDGSQVVFVLASRPTIRNPDNPRWLPNMEHSIGIVDVRTGKTTITSVAGLLGVTTY